MAFDDAFSYWSIDKLKSLKNACAGGVIFYRNPARYYSIIFQVQFIESIVWYGIIIECYYSIIRNWFALFREALNRIKNQSSTTNLSVV